MDPHVSEGAVREVGPACQTGPREWPAVHVGHPDAAPDISRPPHADYASAVREGVVAIAFENEALAKADRGNPGEVAVASLGPKEIASSRRAGVLRMNPIEPDADGPRVLDPDVGRHPVVLDLAIPEPKHVTVVVRDGTEEMQCGVFRL